MNKLAISVFVCLLSLVSCGDIGQTFLELGEVDNDKTKLNWKVLSDAMSEMLTSVQNAREIEKSNQETKKAILQKVEWFIG